MKWQSWVCWLFCVLFSLLSFYPSTGLSEPFEGVAVLAMKKKGFPCQRLNKALKNKQRPAVQVLWGTFGNSTQCLRRFVHRFKDRPHLVAINISNGSCRRFNRCGTGEIWPSASLSQEREWLKRGKTKPFVRRAKRVRKRLERLKNDNTTLRLYPQLEDNWSNREFYTAATAIEREWPHEIYRSAIVKHGTMLGYFGLELHGLGVFERLARANKASWSNDGISVNGCSSGPSGTFANSIDPSQMRGAITSARAVGSDVFLWCARWQGYSDNFKPPREREISFQRSDVLLIKNLLKD
jgi:hypothetical protein